MDNDLILFIPATLVLIAAVATVFWFAFWPGIREQMHRKQAQKHVERIIALMPVTARDELVRRYLEDPESVTIELLKRV